MAAIRSAIVVFGVMWLVAPSIAAADDCSDWSLGEVSSCPNYAMLKLLGFIAGAIAAAAAAMKSWKSGTRDLTPEEREQVMRQLAERGRPPLADVDMKNYTTQNSAYDPGGINMGGGGGPQGGS